jgi:hypothetical protein
MSGTGQQAKTGKEGPLMWIDAYKSVTNQLNTYGNNIELADVEETGENKLVVADFNGMVTIYKGTNVDWQFQLQDPVNCIGQFTINSGKMSRFR